MALVGQLGEEVRTFIEDFILDLADAHDIRVVFVLDKTTALWTGGLALAGALTGGLMGGKMGGLVGAGVGGATGLAVGSLVFLREVWPRVKATLKDLVTMVYDFLRRLDPFDYMNAARLLMNAYNERRDLVRTLVTYIAERLGRDVMYNFA